MTTTIRPSPGERAREAFYSALELHGIPGQWEQLPDDHKEGWERAAQTTGAQPMTTTTQATAHALIQRWKQEGGMLESVLCLLVTQALDDAQKSGLGRLETILRAVHHEADHYDIVYYDDTEKDLDVAGHRAMVLEEVADRMGLERFALD